MTWFIEYTDPTGEKRRLRIDEGASLKIGRGSTSDTKIEDTAMSRVHCELSLSSGVPILADLGSSGGTLVDRKKIVDPRELSSGQTFQAGNTKFKVVSDSPLDAPTQVVGSRSTVNSLAKLAEKLLLKKTFDRFILKRLVNDTGRNLVFMAEDTENEMMVAIKVLPTDEASEEDEARFKRAIGILQEVRDPCLIKLFRAGRKRTYCWVAMEWMPGGSLDDRIQKYGINGCLEWKDAWRVAHCISQSLYVLEREGIVHRNIKPTNILFNDSKNVFLLSDLVVAKAEDTSNSKLVTRQVFLPSDLAYTAPERLLGNEANAATLQSDIYSLGAVLTKLLTGEPPYGHGELRDMLPRLKERRRRVAMQGQIGINELFVDLVNGMTEPEPRKRFSTALKLWNEVERVGKLAGLSPV
ncbi:MAG: FHA domain-containing serine/threonine-protein kinase [Pirellulaceae bacterium]|nr:FHA domain-containing serine/threonine-protein kinase [Pirellulaceae bacterium]